MKPDPDTYPLTQRGLKCPDCHSEIFSNSRYDWVDCACGNIFVDGGPQFSRSGGSSASSAELVSRWLPRRPPPYYAQELRK